MILAKSCTGVSVASGGAAHVKSVTQSARSGSAVVFLIHFAVLVMAAACRFKD